MTAKLTLLMSTLMYAVFSGAYPATALLCGWSHITHHTHSHLFAPFHTHTPHAHSFLLTHSPSLPLSLSLTHTPHTHHHTTHTHHHTTHTPSHYTQHHHTTHNTYPVLPQIRQEPHFFAGFLNDIIMSISKCSVYHKTSFPAHNVRTEQWKLVQHTPE